MPRRRPSRPAALAVGLILAVLAPYALEAVEFIATNARGDDSDWTYLMGTVRF